MGGGKGVLSKQERDWNPWGGFGAALSWTLLELFHIHRAHDCEMNINICFPSANLSVLLHALT